MSIGKILLRLFGMQEPPFPVKVREYIPTPAERELLASMKAQTERSLQTLKCALSKKEKRQDHRTREGAGSRSKERGLK